MAHQSDPSPSVIQSKNIRISKAKFNQNINLNVDQTTEPLNHIYDQVAHNAVLNEDGRADPVRCAEGTRVETREAVKKWAKSGYESDRRIFWLSGPAGAGKSAIVQSLAEGYKECNIPMANFFFFRGDATRSHSRPLVATLLHQLIELEPQLGPRVSEIIRKDPNIVKRPLRRQFTDLLKGPVNDIRRGQPDLPPIILLIDGLDECDGDKEQNDVLFVLNALVTPKDSPFIALVASRPEAHLKMTFHQLGISSSSINLDDQHQTSEEDIARFTAEELQKIKASHPLRHLLASESGWPLQTDIDAIVTKSSGQFLYAATVLRFISNPNKSPAESLKVVLGLRPIKQDSPFAAIDAIYTYILLQADDWAAVRDVLAAQILLITHQSSFPVQFSYRSAAANLIHMLSPLGRTKDDIASCLSRLAAVLLLDAVSWTVQFYHASMTDFLFDQSRSGDFFIDLNEVACRLVSSHFKHITDYDTMELSFGIFHQISEPDKSVSNVLRTSLPSIQPIGNDEDRKAFGQLAEIFLTKLKGLYGRISFILIVWRDWFHQNKIPVKRKWYDGMVAKLAPIVN